MSAAASDGRTIQNCANTMSNPDNFNDLLSCRSLLSKVMSLSACNANLAPLLLSAVKLLAHSDLCIKKMAAHILCQYGDSSSELMLLGINTLIKDCYDSNPMVRGFALKTLCSLQFDCTVEFTESVLQNGLSDKSAYVRRAAVLGCLKVFQLNEGCIPDSNIIDQLYTMIRDPDPIVVDNCLSTLEEMLHGEGGIVVNKNINHHLLNRIHEFPNWSQIHALTLLKKYSPTSDDEVFDILNILDPLLKHNSCSVICSTLDLFLHTVKSMPQLQGEICRRANGPIISQLGSRNVELIYTILNFLSSIPQPNIQVFSSDYLSFFGKHKESQYLKSKKMEFLARLLNKDNEQAILDELCLHCSDGSPVISQYAVETIARISETHKHLSEDCLDRFKVLLESSSNHVVSNILQAIQCMPLEDLDNGIISLIGNSARTVLDDAGIMAVLQLLGTHGQRIEDVPYILEDFVDRFGSLASADIRQQLLFTVVQVFFCHPAETQAMMGILFEECINDPDRNVQDRAEFYFRILEMDVNFAKTVICGSKHPMS